MFPILRNDESCVFQFDREAAWLPGTITRPEGEFLYALAWTLPRRWAAVDMSDKIGRATECLARGSWAGRQSPVLWGPLWRKVRNLSIPIGLLYLDGYCGRELIEAEVRTWSPLMPDRSRVVFRADYSGGKKAAAKLLLSGGFRFPEMAGGLIQMEKYSAGTWHDWRQNLWFICRLAVKRSPPPQAGEIRIKRPVRFYV